MMKSKNLKCMFVLLCLLLAVPARMMAQEVDELQRLLDEYAARDAGKRKVREMRKADGTTMPTGLQEIDLSKLTSYTKSTRTVTVKSDIKFVNGTIGAADNFSGTYLLNITEGATVVLGETASVDASNLSCGACLAAVNICGGSTFYQCGNVTAPDNGNCVAIRLDSRNDTYIYVSGERKGTVQNTNGGTVVDNVLLGDVNNDGTVNIADALCLFSWLLENNPAVFIPSAADFNHDNAITVSDGVAIIASLLDTPQSYLSCPDNNHPHMIDLGLPSGTKWACCNVGATKPEEYGGYYAWGETEEKATYEWNTYIHCDGTKESRHSIGLDISGTQYDVAHVKWGDSWMMPSRIQNKELIDNCTFEWTIFNGINGGRFTGKNGGTIFLPAAGWFSGSYGGPWRTGEYGYYWSSSQSPSPSFSYNAYKLMISIYENQFDEDHSFIVDERCEGFTVRPVSK